MPEQSAEPAPAVAPANSQLDIEFAPGLFLDIVRPAADYGIRPDAIGLWGSSAGGHLAALAGLLGPVATLDGEQPSPVGAGVQAVMDGYGAADLLAPDQDNPPTAGLLGGAPAEHTDLAIQASPARQVGNEAPPFLIMHGAADPLVPATQSIALYDALAAIGADVTLYLIEGFGHGFLNSAGLNKVPGGWTPAGSSQSPPLTPRCRAPAPTALGRRHLHRFWSSRSSSRLC
ncbi:prolyl oligopeptidase family serine peptidase [Cryobacterium sp.]|jgi:acetyl esterase/lipase|uniref:prolyl oligopeptidase family serine peptidase n=1 Tax=Cryobacterium sp. TaxID=1926290 RepID=UPI00260A23BA|nr:prolyl oligopeptidase family serine peptidase [Cryobacterium sp.]MCU1445359.1 Isoprenylcysteine alpha-carbonyl methylesterase [Cryobacterium sp.]